MGIKRFNEQQAVEAITEDKLLSNNISMSTKIELALNISRMLKPLLQHNNLVVKMRGGKEYVTAEGWNTLGTLLGLSPITEYVKPIQLEGESLAFVSAVSIKQGDTIISRAESIATASGNQKDPHAIYSMAQTRAMGKAYRMCLSWIMTLAGYQATPAEEMVKDVKVKDEVVKDNKTDIKDKIIIDTGIKPRKPKTVERLNNNKNIKNVQTKIEGAE